MLVMNWHLYCYKITFFISHNILKFTLMLIIDIPTLF